MASKEYNNLIAKLSSMPVREQRKLVGQIMNMLKENKATDIDRCTHMVKEHTFKNEMPDCPHCKAKAKLGSVIKKGYNKGAQRFLCKTCGRYFVATTNTVFENTRKPAAVWEKYIQLTISGESLRTCADECEISIQTAFDWRHKILNALKIQQNNMMMSGKVEMDEMLIPISYKGNHIPGWNKEDRTLKAYGSNNLPRRSFERGSDNRSVSSKNKACVCCMVKNGNEGFYGVVPGVGFMQNAMLDHTIGKHVDKENTLVLVDNYKITKNYLEDNQYKYMCLLSNTSDNSHAHKPEVRDGNHLQHVNALHHHLRVFLANYSGVSTKYLENYVSLYMWIKNINAIKQKRYAKKHTVSRLSNSDCYITRKQIEALPAVPACA